MKAILRYQVVKEIEVDIDKDTFSSNKNIDSFWNDLSEKENAIKIKGIFIKDKNTNRKIYRQRLSVSLEELFFSSEAMRGSSRFVLYTPWRVEPARTLECRIHAGVLNVLSWKDTAKERRIGSKEPAPEFAPFVYWLVQEISNLLGWVQFPHGALGRRAKLS